MPAIDTFTGTRRALHGLAELLLAGPQHALSGTIKLRPVTGGFATTRAPDVRVEGTAVVAGDVRAEIDGRTPRALADALGLTPVSLAHVYHDGSGVGLDDVLAVDAESAARIAEAYAVGDEALRAVAPELTPVLWPEHFDLGIAIEDERVNLGISPGDAAIPTPYVYVGPWDPRAVDDYWNESFGAARPLPASAEEIAGFFADARQRLRG